VQIDVPANIWAPQILLALGCMLRKLHFKSDCILWGTDCRHIGVKLSRFEEGGKCRVESEEKGSTRAFGGQQLLLFFYCRVVSWRHFEHKAQICQQLTQTDTQPPTLSPTQARISVWQPWNMLCLLAHTHTHTRRQLKRTVYQHTHTKGQLVIVFQSHSGVQNNSVQENK